MCAAVKLLQLCSTQTPRVTRPLGCSLLSLGRLSEGVQGALDKKTALPSTQVVVVQHQEGMWHRGYWDCTGGLCEAENHNWCSHVHSVCREWSWEPPIPNHSQALSQVQLACSKMEAGVK